MRSSGTTPPVKQPGPVLAAAGLTPESRRLFISYRRLETEPLAEHLFEAFNRAVLVFSWTALWSPCVDFQRRLDQELGDKAMVLVARVREALQFLMTAHRSSTRRYRWAASPFTAGMHGRCACRAAAVDQ